MQDRQGEREVMPQNQDEAMKVFTNSFPAELQRLGPQRISVFRRPGEKWSPRPRGPQPCSKVALKAFAA